MKKTALAKLIDWSQNDLEIFIEDSDEALRIFKAINDKATELLEEERQDLMDAHYEGGCNTNGSVTESERYFNNTFE